ncbi:MAG: phage integrase N-terminal SAM-like domain-containing protein [Acidobacteriota bacterium]
MASDPREGPQAQDGPRSPRLLDRVRAAARLRHFSRRTEATYVDWVRRFILFHGKRHPGEIGPAEVVQFLTHLAEQARVSASTQNQALCAVLFLYRHVLGRDLGLLDGIVWAKRAPRVPVVLSPDEVARLLDRLRGTPWLVAVLLYGAGLRLSECLDAGAVGASGREHDDDVYACDGSWGVGGPESGRPAAGDGARCAAALRGGWWSVGS